MVAFLVAACSLSDDQGASSPNRGTNAPSDENVVIAGDSISELRLGQTTEEALATGLITEPGTDCDYRNEATGEITYLVSHLHGGGLQGFAVFQEGVLVTIGVQGGAETEAGLRPGDSLHRVSTLYPQGDYVVAYDEVLSEAHGGQVITVQEGEDVLFSVHVPSGEDTISELWLPYPWACGGD